MEIGFGGGSMNLLVFGCGYSASFFLKAHYGSFVKISATTRGQRYLDRVGGVEYLTFDGNQASIEVLARLTAANAILISVPPNPDGDPVLAHFRDALEKAPTLTTMVYLSTIGVYGDHSGAWIDEDTRPAPQSARSLARLKAEEGWLEFGRNLGKTVHILRLAGIYGPGQNALENLRTGTARQIVKAGQVFNRIHVEDIARSIAAAFSRKEGGIWNVSDNEPAPPQDVIAYAAGLLGIAPPVPEPFLQADLTPMARSFYSENKRVSNRRLREVLGVSLGYPTYREGLTSLATDVTLPFVPVGLHKNP